jgi:hypothetical protein
MRSRFVDHLTKYNILSMEQWGFRTNLTTENAAYKVTNVNLNALSNK